MRQAVFALVAAVSATASASAEVSPMSATPEQIADIAQVVDDPFQPTIRISTQPFDRPRLARTDVFLRSYVDRGTREATFQVYFMVSYRSDFQNYDRMSYLTDQGPKMLQGTHLGSDVNCSTRYTVSCTRTEELIVEVPESLLRTIAHGVASYSDGYWPIRIYGRYERGLDVPLLKTEIAGILMATDRVRSGRSEAP